MILRKENGFVQCKTKIEIVTKTATQRKNYGVLFCVLENEVYVYQKFKTLKLSIELFMEGMEIDFATASAIVYGGAETLEQAKEMVAKDLAEIEAKKKLEVVETVVEDDIDLDALELELNSNSRLGHLRKLTKEELIDIIVQYTERFGPLENDNEEEKESEQDVNSGDDTE